MSEVLKDSAIKLFGRTISLPRNNEVSANDFSKPVHHDDDCSDHTPASSSSSPREVSTATEHEAEKDNKDPSKKELTLIQDDEASNQITKDLKSPTSSGTFENPKSPSSEKETSQPKSSKNEEQRDARDKSVSQDKTPKKPDKILPCPRCNSMDTKFCYYNNYNVNQPRHFCKNCQRYWTAGGTMRNVPVGAGRRKNKSSSSAASHYRQIIVPETLQTAKLNAANGLHSAVLTFGSDSPLCDSTASVLNLAEKTSPNGVALNAFHAPKQNIYVSHGKEENNNGDDSSVGRASVMASNSSIHEEKSVDNKSYQSLPPPQFPFQCGSSTSPWSYPWNPTVPTLAYCQPSYPVSVYPTPAYWSGCLPPSWRVHSISPQSCINQSTTSSSPNSPTLGKHSRDGEIIFPSKSEKEKPSTENSLLIPKTLRIDDPTEAAKSSIWSTLGIKHEKGNNSLNGRGLFKAFASKGDDKNHIVETSPVLQANRAALSRSLIFHERT